MMFYTNTCYIYIYIISSYVFTHESCIFKLFFYIHLSHFTHVLHIGWLQGAPLLLRWPYPQDRFGRVGWRLPLRLVLGPRWHKALKGDILTQENSSVAALESSRSCQASWSCSIVGIQRSVSVSICFLRLQGPKIGLTFDQRSRGTCVVDDWSVIRCLQHFKKSFLFVQVWQWQRNQVVVGIRRGAFIYESGWPRDSRASLKTKWANC